MGFSGLIHWLCSLTGDPAANFANYYPAACLLLLGMAGCTLGYCINPDSFARDAALFAGEIHGRAVNESGEPVPYAQVQVRGTQQVARANSNGNFVLWDLEALPLPEIMSTGCSV